MNSRIAPCLTLLIFAILTSSQMSEAAPSGPHPGFTIDVLVDGRPLQQYPADGTLYIEALKNREYEIRLHNPLPVRVAVALSVDGLNTIDARHTTAASARKWVIGPRGTVTISGWQTSLTHARRFHFTSEERSYAGALGERENLGVISAVFFREQAPRPITRVKPPAAPSQDSAAGASRQEAAPDREASEIRRPESSPQVESKELAATGFGRRTGHAVREVFLNLEDAPATSIDLRYEYRPQLISLGILPAGPGLSGAMTRRERARGFTTSFCPVP